MFQRRGKRLTRFGLKSLLVLTAVVAVWCGYYASQVRWRGQALALIATRGGLVWQRPSAGPTDDSFFTRLSHGYNETVYRLFGNTLRSNVASVEVTDAFLSSDDLMMLASLWEIEWLSVSGSTVDDATLKHLAAFNQLRWLDVSRTDVSFDGVSRLGQLSQLEWLDVSNTQVERKELENLQSQYSDARIGFDVEPAFDSVEFSSADSDFDKNTADANNSDFDALQALSLWLSYQQDPYVKDQLADYLESIGQSHTVAFPNWYISSVYEAERLDQDSLLIVQIYNGVPSRFNLGTLLVFNSGGQLLRTMPGERIESFLLFSFRRANWVDSTLDASKLRQQALARGEAMDLPDFNGDGFDEIPTQRNGARFNGDAVQMLQGEATAIYTTSSDRVPRVFRLGVPNNTPRSTLIDLTSPHAMLVFHSLDENTLVLDTPCVAATPTGTTVLRDVPRRRLAAFVWSDEAGTFVGPSIGPQDTWVVMSSEEAD